MSHVCCRRHRGAITSLVITLDGRFLFSSCSQGSLVQYSCADSQCCVLRVAGQAPSHSRWFQALGSSDWLAFYALIKQAGEEFISSFSFQSIQGSQGRNLKVGTEAEAMEGHRLLT